MVTISWCFKHIDKIFTAILPSKEAHRFIGRRLHRLNYHAIQGLWDASSRAYRTR